MEIHLNLTATGKEIAIAVGFKASELNFALAVLKGIQNVVKADFIQEAVDDLEAALKPKALPFINHWHWCINCGRDINEKDDNTMCITHDGDTKWKCRECKPLKTNRPQ